MAGMRLTGLLVWLLMFGPAGAAIAQSEPAPIAAAVGDLTLTAPDGRSISVFVWPAAEERAVIVFSHGFGGVPVAYQEILTRWSAAGFTVMAPLHLDSRRHPESGNVAGARAFLTRLADLAAVRAEVKSTRPDKPLIVAGHSFGSLMSLIQAGAVTGMGSMGDPDVTAVIALSSAGDVAGLVTPQTYAGLSAPLLMITGDADVVPDYAPDWRAHRSPFDRAPPGEHMLMIFEGGTHSLVADGSQANRDLLATVSLDFMRAHALDDAAAKARLDALSPPPGVRIERR